MRLTRRVTSSRCWRMGVGALFVIWMTACGADDAPPPEVAAETERACPSMIPPPPHVEIALAPPIDRDREIRLEVVVDGAEERCALRVSGVSPGRASEGAVESPTTQAEVDCPSLTVATIGADGAIHELRSTGRPTSLTVRAFDGDRPLGTASGDPLEYAPYEPFGEGCGEVDRASLTLDLAPERQAP